MPLWGGFINFVISLISYNVYNIIYYIYVCPCWRVGRLRLGGVGMLYPCAPHAPTGGRGWYGCNRVGRWPVGRFRARWRGFGRWVGMLYPCAPVWPSEGRKLPRLACWGWPLVCWACSCAPCWRFAVDGCNRVGRWSVPVFSYPICICGRRGHDPQCWPLACWPVPIARWLGWSVPVPVLAV